MTPRPITTHPLRRRHWLVAHTLAAGVVVVAACASGTPSPGATDGRDGVAPSPPLPVAAPSAPLDPHAIADLDGSVVAGIDDGRLTFTGTDGDELTSTPVGPGDQLRTVSADGERAALLRTVAGASLITVVDRSAGEPVSREYRLPGLVEPEAFSTDGTILYVIDHQVATAYGAYRVRPLVLATGRLDAILGPTKAPLLDDMNGVGRRQVWSPDGTRLNTLYIRQTHHHHDDGDHAHGDPGTDGFVHILDLDDEWAYCLDLPEGFGAGDLATTALAVSPDGRTLAVADMTARRIAFASTAELAITRTVAIPALDLDGELQLGITSDAVALGAGSTVHWFDQRTLEPLTAEPVQLDQPLLGLTAGSSGLLAWPTVGDSGPVTLRAPGR